MKTYQPNNGPIKFVVVNTEYNDDHTYNKTTIDVVYTTKKDNLVYQHNTVGRKQPQSIDVPTKMSQEVDVHIGLLGIEGNTPRNIDTSKVTWKLSIDKTPYDTSLRSPYYVTNHTTINNTDYDFNKLLGDIADTIVQYYENHPTEPPNKEEVGEEQNVPKEEGQIKFVELTRTYDEYGCSVIVEVICDTKKWVVTQQNGVVTKVNRGGLHLGVLDIRFKATPTKYCVTSDITCDVYLSRTPYGTVLQSPHHISNRVNINATNYAFNEMLDGIAEKIVQYYKNTKMEQSEKGIDDMKESECNQGDMTQLPDAIRRRIKINNIIYNLDGVPNQSPTPIYEIEVDLTGIDVYPHIKSVLLNAYVCYDGASQKFHTKVETVRINGVSITDFQLDDAGFLELTAIYMHDALKRIDFTSAIENHLRMLNSRLDQCHKILNSDLES